MNYILVSVICLDSYIATGAAARMFFNDNVITFDQAASGSADAAVSFTTAMKIDSSGNVGIGTESPAFSYGSLGLEIQSTGDTSLRLERDGSTAFEISARSSDILIYNPGTARNFRFGLGGTEKFRMTTGGAFHATDDVVAYSTTPSDEKLKTNIKDIDYGLDTILKLKPKQYDWKKDNRHDIGFIAQDVEEVIPEIVKDNEWFDDKIKTMDYEKLTAVLIKAVQEQQQQINELKEKLNG